jgi:2-polyprenyl-3-methyl-5-hydroxy-6-metoxy-1,4-benzoquinol methylase
MTSTPYDDISDWYDDWVGGDVQPDDPVLLAVDSLMGEVAGQRICDLGCGQGRVARHLARRGAQVVGVDLSLRLLAIARRHEAAEPRGITYRHGDARSLTDLETQSFDGVLCYMALMDISELAPTLHAAARVLRPCGWFIFSIIHPCFNSAPSGEMATPAGWVRTVHGYWNEGYWRSDARTGPPGKVGSYHRTLSTYVNALADAGLMLEYLHEPRATGSFAERRPIWAEVPAFLIARCRKETRDGQAAI